VDDAQKAWEELEPTWQQCLELAWESYSNNTVPAGAVITGSIGEVVAVGRNRIFERNGPSQQISNSYLAHAEVNALLGLDPEGTYEDHAIYASLEPCDFCVGAVGMTSVGTLHFAGADPYAGATMWERDSRHWARKRTNINGPRNDPFGRWSTALHVVFYLQRKPRGTVVAAHRDLLPQAVVVAAGLHQRGIRAAAENGVALADYLPGVWDLLVEDWLPTFSQ
jgi:tRNA(Arg) A34 adenosine deaminase TadA